jgi:GNAT superfamily N-acetyltransferase
MILTATTAEHFALAQPVLDAQRRWLDGLFGGTLHAIQPSSVLEYDDPASLYSPPAGALLLALAGGETAGVVGITPRRAGVAELKRMYVVPAARGIGLGRDLVAAGLETAGSLGYGAVELETWPDGMPGAVPLYERFGFRKVEAPSAFGPGVIWMRRDLEEARNAA